MLSYDHLKESKFLNWRILEFKLIEQIHYTSNEIWAGGWCWTPSSILYIENLWGYPRCWCCDHLNCQQLDRRNPGPDYRQAETNQWNIELKIVKSKQYSVFYNLISKQRKKVKNTSMTVVEK